MAVDVEVPNQGLTVTEATVVAWHRKVGESVRAGEPLLTIETDKAAQEIEAPVSGTLLEALAAEGDIVPLGHVVGRIGVPAAAEAPPAPVPAGAGAVRNVASPRVRRLARERGIDLAQVAPGADGRIHARDLPAGASATPKVSPTPTLLPAPGSGRFRALTARITTESFRDIPHFYLERQIRADRLIEARAQIVDDVQVRHGVRITVTDFLLLALARALAATPEMTQGRTPIDLGLAIDTPEGLAAPVLRDVAARNLVELAKARAALVERARADRLAPDELSGGVATLSNLGASGVDRFQAILVPGQVAILAAGAIRTRPFVIDERLTACPTLFLTASIDHRQVDGAVGARFLDRLADALENPARLCLP